MSEWDRGEWDWSIVPETAHEREREDPVKRGGSVVTRWSVPVMRFDWQAFPETLAHHDVFMSLN